MNVMMKSIIFLIVGTIVTNFVVWFTTPLVKGPAFLAAYGVGGVVLLGYYLYEEMNPVGALIIFETAGVIRFLTGRAIGMQNFQIMFIMMLFGGVIILVCIKASMTAGGIGGSCGGGGGGAGCSGGGGGGGGCGGCGG